jgi:pimeloyl-ACP methyl ester carboxylesterase
VALPPGLSQLAYGALLVGGRVVLPEIDRMRPELAAREMIDRPLLVFAGSADERAPVADAQRIAREVHGSRVVVLEGAGHNSAIRRALGDEGMREIAQLLSSLLPLPRSGTGSRGGP